MKKTFSGFFKQIVIFAILVFSIISGSFAGPGDTIHVQTFTYASPQDAWFVFPSDTVRFCKILMNYKLRCPYNNICGEWDYLTYTYLYDYTGKYDSTLYYAPSFSVNGANPDTLEFMNSPSWTYFPVSNYSVSYIDTTSFDTAVVGAVALQSAQPFFSSAPVSRTQYLWKAAELAASGLTTGNITGIRFNLASAGSAMKHLKIKLKNSGLDSINAASYESSGFIEAYNSYTSFVQPGWNSIQFITPFNWDGVSNIIIEITFENDSAGVDNPVMADNTGFPSGIFSAGNDHCLFFQDVKYMDVPAQSLAPVDSFITVAFWQYGNPVFQPQNNTLFEGADSAGNRVINVHLPWGNSNVYWDAGNTGGSHDRINAAANTGDFEGQWNHWAFTKNAASGVMNIYRNGSLFLSGTGKTKLMKGIKSFKVGSNAKGLMNYDGSIDEFAVWNAELDSTTIKSWMYKGLSAAHPFDQNLLLNYQCNNNTFFSTPDSSGNGYNAALAGPPASVRIESDSLFRNFAETSLRPQIVFEQGVFTADIDTIISVDFIANNPFQIVIFGDTNNPTTPTDTILGWQTYYNNYVFDNNGNATDSSFVAPDSVLYLLKTPYYGAPFEVINRYELGRYITPYGNNLSLGNGVTWVFDVSDYAMLLHDSVRLSAGNNQELLDLSFDMIEGIPPRYPISITNLWSGHPSYGCTPTIEDFLVPKKIKIDDASLNTRIKMRPTGHGFGGNENCAEFCSKRHKFVVNGTERFSREAWKDDCALNPVYPQGGTWVYSRANWCPGDDVPTFDFELTPYVNPGDSVTIDYNVDAYTWNGQGSRPSYVIETQLIGYSAPNFTNDAAVYDIKAPGTNDMFKRRNPVCSNPVMVIQNTGSNTLTSLTITYGVVGAPQSVYHWSGSLAFTDTVSVKLNSFSFAGTGHIFQVSVSNPNGAADQYALNNTMQSVFTDAPEFPADLVFELKTNNAAYETSYKLMDSDGNIILSKSGLTNNTLYRDTVHLDLGCYELILSDTDDDGLSWWANSEGAGYFRIRKAINNVIVKNYGTDFGREIYQQFTVGYNLSIAEAVPENEIIIYPNPTDGIFTLSLALQSLQNINFTVLDIYGKKVYENNWNNISEGKYSIDLSAVAAGFYYAVTDTGNNIEVKKLVITGQ